VLRYFISNGVPQQKELEEKLSNYFMIYPLPLCNICREHDLGVLRSLGMWSCREEKAFWPSRQITRKFHLVSADTSQSCDDKMS